MSDIDDEFTVDIGYEVSTGGQKSRVWLRPQDVRHYIEDLRTRLALYAGPDERIGELTAALHLARHVIEKGIEVRMGDQWSILRDILPDVVAKINVVLGDRQK